jgi:pimeloyl-ACP methyl ester carboxylesterase
MDQRLRSVSGLYAVLLLLVLSYSGCKTAANKLGPGIISFNAEDGLPVTASLYIEHDETAPFIVLFHRAHWSRGEYLEIAPKLNEMGFNCMAVDQRSGGEINGVINETHSEAQKREKPRFYVNAVPDVEAALRYARDSLKADRILLWGSSYSASLVFMLAERYPDDVDGIVAFSPGEYLTVDEKMIEEFAREVRCPVFVASAASEVSKWESIFESIPTDKKVSFTPETGGKHGSEALWEKTEGHEEYWKALEGFLDRFLPEE